MWQADKATSSFGSPVVVDERAYFVNRVGVVFCLDLETGKAVFNGRSPSKSVWATPFASGDHIYLFGKDGTSAVIRRGDKLEVVARNKLWNVESKPEAQEQGGPGNFGGPVLYAAATSGDRLLLRRGDTLFAVGGK